MAGKILFMCIIDFCITKDNKIEFSGTYTDAFAIGLLDNQTRFMEKGTQQFTFGTNLTERRVNGTRQFLGVFGREVSEFDEFTVRPNGFNRVEFRGVRRQPLNRDVGTMFGEELADDFSLMNLPVVHDEYFSVWNTSSDTTQESQDFFRSDVMRVDSEEEIKPFTLRRDTNSADNRESIVSLPVFENGSFSFDRPSLSDDGLKHKSRFVNENDRLFFPSWPVVLSLASSPCATVLPALRFALLLCAGVFDNSSLEPAESSTHGRDDTLSQTSVRLPLLFVAVSITDLDTQKPLALSVILSETELSVPGSYGKVDADGVVPLRPFVPPSLPSLSSDVLMKLMNQLDLTLLLKSNLVLTASSHAVFAFPMLLDSLWVSCTLLYINLASFGSANINNIRHIFFTGNSERFNCTCLYFISMVLRRWPLLFLICLAPILCLPILF